MGMMIMSSMPNQEKQMKNEIQPAQQDRSLASRLNEPKLAEIKNMTKKCNEYI